MMQQGVKETMEVVRALGELAKVGARVGADRKVDLADLQHLLSAAQSIPLVVTAIQDVGQIPLEVKDLSAEEIQLVLGELLAIVKDVKRILTPAVA